MKLNNRFQERKHISRANAPVERGVLSDLCLQPQRPVKESGRSIVNVEETKAICVDVDGEHRVKKQEHSSPYIGVLKEDATATYREDYLTTL